MWNMSRCKVLIFFSKHFYSQNKFVAYKKKYKFWLISLNIFANFVLLCTILRNQHFVFIFVYYFSFLLLFTVQWELIFSNVCFIFIFFFFFFFSLVMFCEFIFISLYQCKDSINSNFEIQPTGNHSYPGLPKRKKSK